MLTNGLIHFFCKMDLKKANIFFTDLPSTTPANEFNCMPIKLNGKKLLERFLKNVEENSPKFKVYLIDNASQTIQWAMSKKTTHC